MCQPVKEEIRKPVNEPAGIISPEKKNIPRIEPVITPPLSPAVTPTVRMRDVAGNVENILSIRKAGEPAENAGIPVADEERELAEPFTAEQLDILWDSYAEKIREESPLLCTTLKNNRPVLVEGMLIRVTLESKLIGDELALHKTGFLEFIRSGLRNYSVGLEVLIDEKVREKRPYTDREKFERMAEKNPALINLKEKLDLEIGY